MAEPERVSLFGPFGVDGSTEFAREFTLYTAESYTVEGETDTKKESVPTTDSEESILTPIEGSRSFSLSGVTSLELIHRRFGGSDEKESLRRWLYTLESLVTPQQGLGYELRENLRDGTIQPSTDEERGVLVGEVRWTLNVGDITRVEWNVELDLSEGVQEVQDNPELYVDRQFDSTIERDELISPNGRVELTEVDTRRVTRSVDLSTLNILHDTDVPVTGLIDSGVDEEVDFEGHIVERDDSLREQKARFIDTEIHGEPVVITDEFTGRAYRGAASSSSVEFEEGYSTMFTFRISLDVGDVKVDID